MGNSLTAAKTPQQLVEDTSPELFRELFVVELSTFKERATAAAAAGLSVAAIPEDESALATADENVLVKKIQEVFAETFAVRDANGTNYPEFFGDIYLTRVVRGAEGDILKAIYWFASMVLALNEYGADSIYPRAKQILAKCLDEGRRVQCSDFSNFDKVSKFHKSIFSLKRKSPSGDLINYQPQHLHGCNDTRGILENCYGQYVEYFKEAFLMNMLELDQMSREEGRIVRKACVFDLFGISGMPGYKPFDEKCQQDIWQYQPRLAPDIFGNIFVTNAPWFVVRAFSFMRNRLSRWNIVPERTVNKIEIYSDNGASDPVILKFVGAEQLMELYAWRPLVPGDALGEAAMSGQTSISPGHTLERVLGVAPGQHVSWRWQVQAGTMLLGSNVDIGFSVEMIVDPPEGTLEEPKQEIVKDFEIVSVDQGEVFGEFLAPAGGMLRLIWSNEHSWLRGKDVTFSIDAGKDAK